MYHQRTLQYSLQQLSLDVERYQSFWHMDLSKLGQNLFESILVLIQGLLHRLTEHSIMPIYTGGGHLTLIVLHKLTQSL